MMFSLLSEDLHSLLEAIVESSEDAIFSKTLDGLVLSWNTGAERLYGYSAHEMIGHPIHTIVPLERRQELADIMQRLSEGHRIAPFETVRRRKDGCLVDVSVTISPVRDATGKIIGASTIARDITERRQLQQQLQASERLFHALIEQSSAAIVLVDPQGKVVYTSPATTRLLGYTSAELLGRNAFDLLHPEDLQATSAMLAALLEDPGKSLRTEFRVRCKDGTFRWMEGTATNSLADPSIGAIVGTFRDITQRKLAPRMNWSERPASEHFVQFYETDEFLLDSLSEFIGTGLGAGNACIIIATKAHRERLEERLKANGLDLAAAYAKDEYSYPLHARDREGLLSAADQAMYGAKHFGRNQVRLAHDPAVRALFSVSPAEGGREEAALVGMAEALVALVEARDHLTGSHCQHVADLVHQLALALGWPATEAQMLTLAARLHDLGKVAVPDTILQKPGALTKEEWTLMRSHPAVGAGVVSHIPALRPLAPVIRAHHERWDGQGYPDQLAGEAIPLGARILTVVDAYLTMLTDRPYQPARAPAMALAELRRCAGSQFDPRLVEALVQLLLRTERLPQDAGGLR
jgi:PAS domain S-box-containing protein